MKRICMCVPNYGTGAFYSDMFLCYLNSGVQMRRNPYHKIK